jgi:hypothetical protein
VHQDGPHALDGPRLLLYQFHKGEQGAGGLGDAVIWPGCELQLLHPPLFILGTLRMGGMEQTGTMLLPLVFQTPGILA